MNSSDENNWLSQIRHKAEDRADPEYYDNLISDVKQRKSNWTHKDEGGEFDSIELAKLIDSAHSVIQYIEKRKQHV